MSSWLKPSDTFVRKTEKDIAVSIKKWCDLEESSKYERLHKAIDHAILFAKRHGLIVYGGQAVNAMLPQESKIYSKRDINDVDVFSPLPKEHARWLAGELDDELGIDFVEAKYSFMHDNSYGVFAGGEKLVDFTYMDKSAIDTLFLRIERNLQPMAPIDFLLYSMHNEFSHPLITPYRWEKTFDRFTKLLTGNPIEYDTTCLSTCFVKPEKEIEKAINVVMKTLKGIEIDRRPPMIGARAVLAMAMATLSLESIKSYVPACETVPVIELLSLDPMKDAQLILEALQKLPGPLRPQPFRSGPWDHPSQGGGGEEEEDGGGDGENSKEQASISPPQRDVTVIKKAQDGQPLVEIVLRYGTRNLVSFVKFDVCSHYVVAGDNIYGGIDTILTFLYKRYLFGASNKSPSSPTSTTLRCLINTMYDVQLTSAERKRTKMTKRFSTSECVGNVIKFMDSWREQRDKVQANRWHYKAYLPEHREERRLQRSPTLDQKSGKQQPLTSNKEHKKKRKNKKTLITV